MVRFRQLTPTIPTVIGVNTLNFKPNFKCLPLTFLVRPLKSTFNGLQFHREQYRSVFIRLAVVGSQICEIPQNSERIRPFSSSRSPRSSILVSIESSYTTSYWSLIVTLDISPTVFEILTFKARKWLVFSSLPCLTPPLGGNTLEFLDETYPTF